MSDSQMSSGDSPRVEPTFEAAPMPSLDPPRFELLPYTPDDHPRRGGLSRSIVWASSIAAALALIAGVSAAALYDHAREASLLAAKSDETRTLAQTVKALKDRIDTIESARSRDESADFRKLAADVKVLGADAHEIAGNLGQVGARIDKLEHDHGARLDKLADRFDHETAGKLADLSTRLDKLEKRPIAAAPAAAPPPKPVAAAPATLAPPAKPGLPPGSTVSNETTGSIERPPLRGYWLVEADEGYAVIDGRDGPQQVAVGDTLPGLGRVQRIERRGRDWVVVTSAGVIAGDQAPF